MHICAHLQPTHSFLPRAHPSAPSAVPRGAVALPLLDAVAAFGGVSERMCSLHSLGGGAEVLSGPGVLLQLGNEVICVAKSDEELPFYQRNSQGVCLTSPSGCFPPVLQAQPLQPQIP